MVSKNWKFSLGPLSILATGILVFSCIKEVKVAPRFYNIDSLVSVQVIQLSNARASIKKVALLGDQQDTTEFQPADTSAWKKELDIFRELNAINKPIYRDAYNVTDGETDTKSNLTICRYTAHQEKLPIEFINVFYYQHRENVRKIEGRYREKNSLYSNARYFTMEFMEFNHQPLLTAYGVTGGQQMFMSDSVQYTITSTITFPD